MQLVRSLLASVALAGLVLAPITANAADSTGGKGRIRSIEINSPHGDTYLNYHGKIMVKHKGTSTEYTWGGTQCPSTPLSAEMVDNLVHAFKARKQPVITPRYKPRAGGVKCLVGFKLSAPKEAGGGGPS